MPKVLKCSFCGRTQFELYKIIKAPKAAICNTCTVICTRVLMETPEESAQAVLSFEVKIGVSRSPEEIAEYFAATRMGGDKCQD